MQATQVVERPTDEVAASAQQWAKNVIYYEIGRAHV